MKLIDISWPITPTMTAYKDRTVVSFQTTKTFEQDHARESVVTLGSHSGTHIDAPAHFLQHGASINQVPLEATIGPCIVIDCTSLTHAITAEFLKQHPLQEGIILVCKTRNSMVSPTDRFNPSFIYLDASAAQYLAHQRIKAVGIDYLGIEREQPQHDTHRILMEHGITIIEGLRLAHVQAGNYYLWCLPLAIVGLEAAPARAILVRES